MGVNFWQILAGIGIFLFGIQLLENALKNLMSRSFKLFLKKQTDNTFKAIFGGTIVTGLLQSSSAVNFMVLAFVSTGVITMRSAFAVIMGANLGTTLDSWIVASLGFKVDIEAVAYPLAGLAGLLIFIFEHKQKFANLLHFLLGFSLLFIGLGLMKDAMEGEAIKSLIGNFSDKSLFVFLLLGFITTTITQSSSATMAITLSILSQQLLGFESAIAIVIGSEVGTSLKLVLGSLDGIAVKKRVAAGNLFYNFITTIVAFAFLHPFAVFITDILNIKDPLIGLVTFQTGINLLSILIFLPFLTRFSKYLEKLFQKTDSYASGYIKNTKPTVADAALELLQKETAFFINQSKLFNLLFFDIDEEIIQEPNAFFLLNEKSKFKQKSFVERYEILKNHYGEIQNFYILLKNQKLNEDEIRALDSLLGCVRSGMYASKCIKDLEDDILELQNSSNAILYQFINDKKQEEIQFYKNLYISEEINEEDEQLYKKLTDFLKLAQEQYTKSLQILYSKDFTVTLSGLEIATLMNFNRELFTSNKSMVMSLKFHFFNVDFYSRFNEIPTYQA